MEAGLNLHYGCGDTSPSEWLNFDASPSLILQKIPILGIYSQKKDSFASFGKNVRYGNIAAGLPIKPDSCDLAYCSHVLEHLSLAELRSALKNTYIYLKKGGVFRGVMPDLEVMVNDYIHSEDKTAALTFIRNTGMASENRSKNILSIIRQFYGNSRHMWLWDYEAISQELKDVGFSEIRRAEVGDNANKLFSLVENKDRWENCLGFECVK